MTPLGIFAADFHLSPTTWVKHPELRDDAYHSLDQVCGFAMQHRVPLFMLGDIFDKARPESESVQVFCDAMARLKQAGIPVYFIRGNHDYTEPPWPLISRWAMSIHKRTERLGRFKIYGLDYTPRGSLAAELAQVPGGTDILVAHQSWSEIQGVGATDGSLSEIHHAGWLITGDYHIHGTWQGESASGPIRVYSPGATCMQALDEPPEKFCLLLSEEGDGRPTITSLPIDTRAFQCHRVTTPASLDQLCTWFAHMPPFPQDHPGVVGRPIYRVQFLDSLPDAYKRLTAALGEPNQKCHFFPEPLHAEVEQVAVQLSPAQIQAGGFDTLESGLAEMLAQNAISPELYAGAVRLLRAADKKAEIALLFQEVLDGRFILPDRVEPSFSGPADLLSAPS